MSHLENLVEYLDSKLIQHVVDGDLIGIGNDLYLLVDEGVLLFDEDMYFLPNTNESVNGFIYSFGGRWYTQDIDNEELQLKELIYIGEARYKLPTNSFLGIRSGYELGNGVGNYSTYISKAKFLGATSLGICEKNTLAGVLDFQTSCIKNGIKSIVGMTISIQGKDSIFDAKVYAKNFQGWLALLRFNTELNVDEQKAIGMDLIDFYKKDIYFVADPKSMPYKEANELFDFYQLDSVNFLDEEKDVEFIDNLELFLKSNMNPISITDSFYLEQEDYETREFMWTFLKKFDDRTDNQYFKCKDEYAKELIQMFDASDSSWIALFKESIKNEKELVDGCNFIYDTDTRHLPKYEMTKEESSKFENNEKLFLHLIKLGLKSKGLNINDYIGRLKEEIDVLKSADVIDYFLSQYDVMKWAQDRNMLTGVGRGSAGGSLIAYLLGITQINPLDFDLLFERFLNKGRMGKFEDRPMYEVETNEGKTISFQEGDLVRIIRDGRETAIFIEDLKENDEIVRY
jgi:DNA polymerase-3 subunit alpha